jgi:hypothetical protein
MDLPSVTTADKSKKLSSNKRKTQGKLLPSLGVKIGGDSTSTLSGPEIEVLIVNFTIEHVHIAFAKPIEYIYRKL